MIALARRHAAALIGVALVLGPRPVAVTDTAQPAVPVKADLAQVAWLAGTWTGGRAPLALEERWTPPAGGVMLAVSRTVKDDRLLEFEFLRMVERDGTLVYIAQPGGRPPTEFVLTAIDETRATFENPAHDFPQKIRYARRGADGLEATISTSDGRKAQTLAFHRAAP